MKKATYRDILLLIKDYRTAYIWATVFLILSSGLGFIVPLIGKITIDGVLGGNTEEIPAIALELIYWLGGQSTVSQNLWFAGIFLMVVSSLSALFLYLRDRFTAKACEKIAKNLRNQLYDHLHHVSCDYHSKTQTGDLIQRCSSDVENVKVFLSKQITAIGRSIILLILIVPLMWALDIWLTFLSLFLVPILILFSIFFFRKVKNVFLEVEIAEGALTTVIQENLTGIRVVRAFARQDFEIEKFSKCNETYKDIEFRLINILSWFWCVTDFICIIQIGAVLFGGSWMVKQGSITMGVLFAFITYVGMVLWPIRHMGRILADTGKALVAYGRIREVIDEPLETDSHLLPKDFPQRLKGTIEFKNVSFNYHNNQLALDNFSCFIKPGSTVSIIGPTGSGKSTLIRLLLRLYDYQKGSITIDGFELNQICRKEIRRQIGTALQEPFLFARTVKENIKLSQLKANDKAVENAAHTACVHDAITAFKKGYETHIGEKGVTLSGGQAQRVALSRTLLKDAPILVLDDTFSAVDTLTEQKILETLQQRFGKKTTLIVTHRLSCCIRSDQILVMDKGRVIQKGDHQTLKSIDGFYQDVWNIQREVDKEIS